MKVADAQLEKIGTIETPLKHEGAQLDELKTAGSEKWEAFQAGAKSAWSNLAVAFKKLTN